MNPLDGSISIPLQFKDNAIGTPLGQLKMPNVDKKISTDDITGKLPTPVQGTLGKAMGTVGKAANPVSHVLSGAAEKTGLAKHGLGLDNPVRGNRLHGHIALPIQVAGNAVALGGDVKTKTDASQNFNRPAAEHTGSDGLPLAGNVAGADGDVPVQLANNAISLGGRATAAGKASQHSSVGGSVTTDGAEAPLGGNTILGHLASPIQVTGNAIGGGGRAAAVSHAESTAAAGGAVRTTGKGGAGSGNSAGAPVALPLELNGNALSGLGTGVSASGSTAQATAGGTNRDGSGHPAYTITNGGSAAASGNIVQPELAGPAVFSGNAGSLIGNAAAIGSTASKTKAGGSAITQGRGSALSGNILNGPVAYPLQAFGDAATLGGNANAAHKNSVDAQAGGRSVSFGDNSVLSSNAGVPTLAGSGDLFGSGVALGGNANGVGSNTGKDLPAQALTGSTNAVKVHSGGYVGTTGNHSVGTGNIAHTPVGLPVEVFGLAGSLVGNATGTADNKKEIEPGGPPNTEDDKGVGSSNIGYLPASVPVELFGDSAHLVGNAAGTADSQLTSKVGGKAHATGTAGTVAGNIVQGPISAPLQGFGDPVGLVGNSTATGSNKTASSAGGPASTDGALGAIAGNVVNLSGAGAGQVFATGANAVGNHTGAASNDTTSVAGGNVKSTGANGAGSGNVLSGDLLPVVQGFGPGASAIGNGAETAINKTATASGGNIATSGRSGSLSGNLLDVPAAGVGQAFGVAGSVAGNQVANGDNNLVGIAGGSHTTNGALGSASGLNQALPLGAVAQAYNVPVKVLGNALTTAANKSVVDVGGEKPQIALPINGGQLPIGALPTLPSLPNLPGLSKLPSLPGLPKLAAAAPTTQSLRSQPVQRDAAPIMARPGALPALPALDMLPSLNSLPLNALPLNALPVNSLPVNSLPVNGLPVNALPSAGTLPGVQTVTGALGGFRSGLLNLDQLLNLGKQNLVPSGVADVPGLPKPNVQSVRPARSAQPISLTPGSVSGELPVLGNLPDVGKLANLDNVAGLGDVLNGGKKFHTLPVTTPASSGLDTSGLTGLLSGKLPTI